jgi:hypothetical protein
MKGGFCSERFAFDLEFDIETETGPGLDNGLNSDQTLDF